MMGKDLNKEDTPQFIEDVRENIPKANTYWSKKVGWEKPLLGIKMIAGSIRGEIFMPPFFTEIVNIAALVERATELGIPDNEINKALFPWEEEYQCETANQSLPISKDFLKVWTDSWSADKWRVLEDAKSRSFDVRESDTAFIKYMLKNHGGEFREEDILAMKFTVACYELPEETMDALLKLAPPKQKRPLKK